MKYGEWFNLINTAGIDGEQQKHGKHVSKTFYLYNTPRNIFLV